MLSSDQIKSTNIVKQVCKVGSSWIQLYSFLIGMGWREI